MQIESLCFNVDEHTLIDNLSVDIPTNTATALIGPAGSGKSVLLKILAGFLKPSSGSILIEHALCTSKYLRKTTSLYPDDYNYLPDETLTELIGRRTTPFFKPPLSHITKHEAQSLISFLGLNPHLDKRLAQINDTLLKKAYLCRAFNRSAEIILLDSPVKGLDINASLQLAKLIRHQTAKKEKQIIVATNDINFALNSCDNYIALKKGKLFLQGRCFDMSKQEIESLYEVEVHLQKNLLNGASEVNWLYQL